MKHALPLVFVSLLAACSGGGGGSPLPATPVITAAPSPTPSSSESPSPLTISYSACTTTNCPLTVLTTDTITTTLAASTNLTDNDSVYVQANAGTQVTFNSGTCPNVPIGVAAFSNVSITEIQAQLFWTMQQTPAPYSCSMTFATATQSRTITVSVTQ